MQEVNETAIVTEVSEVDSPSPTTGVEPPNSSWNDVKCAFCHVKLSAVQEPKLLGCFHTVCMIIILLH
jgi:hypothetical protein